MAGIPTVSISLSPEATLEARPPRSIHPVGFELGHALGQPSQPDLQRRVLQAAIEYMSKLAMPGSVTDIEF